MKPETDDHVGPGEESATVLYLTDRCPLCGYSPLGRAWSPGGPRHCRACGCTVHGLAPAEPAAEWEADLWDGWTP